MTNRVLLSRFAKMRFFSMETMRRCERILTLKSGKHIILTYKSLFARERQVKLELRDHEQRFEPRQRGDDVFHHAVGKILLLRIAAHALKRQN